MNMKLLTCVSATALVGTIVVGLASAGAEEKKWQVGAAIYGLQNEYAQRWAADIKEQPAVKSGEINLTIFDGKYDHLTQRSQFDTMVTQKFDAAIYIPIDSKACDAVVKKAAEAGITITPAHVHTLRSNAKRAGNKGSKTKTSKAATRRPKAVTKASRQNAGATSQFILAQPSTLTATEVVEKGKKAGFSFKANYVYKVRMNANKRTGPVAAAKRAKGTKQRAARKPQIATTRKRKTTRKGTKAYLATGKPAGWIVSVVYSIRRGRASRTRTYAQASIAFVSIGCSIAFLLAAFVFPLLKIYPYDAIPVGIALISVIMVIFLLVGGLMYFRRMEKTFADLM